MEGKLSLLVTMMVSMRNAWMLGNNPVDKALGFVVVGNLVIHAVRAGEFGVPAGFHVVAEARTPGMVQTAFLVGAQ